MARIALHALGCRLNEAEIERLSLDLQSAGHTIVRMEDAPDVVVLNTCGVTADAMRKSRHMARRLARHRPQCLVIMGCALDLTPLDAAFLSAFDQAPCAGDPADQAQISRGSARMRAADASGEHIATQGEASPSHISPAAGLSSSPSPQPIDILHIRREEKPFAARHILARVAAICLPTPRQVPEEGSHRAHTRGFIKIQDGCNNQCSYCAVRLARGSERSEPAAAVLEDVRAQLARGCREIVLTGVQLGAWREGECRLPELLCLLLEETPAERLRLSSIEPWHVGPSLWRLWESPRLCPHFHIPVQSGSDAVLKAMRRRILIPAFLERLSAIRLAIPGVRISTDLIVGFPGETDAMWAETLDFIDAAAFDDVHLFRFSPRPGTEAASLPNPLGDALKRARYAQAQARIETIRRLRLADCLGSAHAVLWESAEKPVGGKRLWKGYSANYLLFRREFEVEKTMRGTITHEIFDHRDLLPRGS